MKKYNKSEIIINPILSRKDVSRSTNPNGYTFSEEEFQAIKKLGGVLQRIHNRLIKEGYLIEDGVLYAPDGSVEYERPEK